MSDRFFLNNLADYSEKEEANVQEILESGKEIPRTAEGYSVNLAAPFRHPHLASPEKLLKSALALKDEIVQVTWGRGGTRVKDPIFYTGVLGTAYLCLKSFEVTQKKEDLALCSEIIDHCAAAAQSMKQYVTFICGQPGIYALGMVAAKSRGDQQRVDFYLNLFEEVYGGLGMPYELLYGRAGFLWASLFVNMHIGNETIPWTTTGPIVDAILAAGRAGASQSSCPLMYQWHGTRYWGAAHGLAGIMYVLMHFALSARDAADVKETLLYMIANRFQSGNYPSSDGNQRDKLIHWCHGAPGICLTLCKAAKVFPEPVFREAAVAAGELIWKKGLLRRVGLCHGVSGNTYPFLALYRLTGDRKHLFRARSFATFLCNQGRELIDSGDMHGGDHPYSLFEGLAGTAFLWLDLQRPEEARFPGYEL
ncbi:hypothetical protein SELMODRAFT_86123 [Selaginella moellendorffii]|uniref:Uncharacterized protein n=1 Tax=Selaginella moellendorffii TaxID=88036 RepID=D8R5G6_SELML|nr:hypothetical protein SELMODRAFT_86123 [Selaginella moellendorffii]